MRSVTVANCANYPAPILLFFPTNWKCKTCISCTTRKTLVPAMSDTKLETVSHIIKLQILQKQNKQLHETSGIVNLATIQWYDAIVSSFVFLLSRPWTTPHFIALSPLCLVHIWKKTWSIAADSVDLALGSLVTASGTHVFQKWEYQPEWDNVPGTQLA